MPLDSLSAILLLGMYYASIALKLLLTRSYSGGGAGTYPNFCISARFFLT